MNLTALLPVYFSPSRGEWLHRLCALRALFLFAALTPPALQSQSWSADTFSYIDGSVPGNVYHHTRVGEGEPIPATAILDNESFNFSVQTEASFTETGDLRTRPWVPRHWDDNPEIHFWVREGASLVMEHSNFGGIADPSPTINLWAGANVTMEGYVFPNVKGGTVIFNRDFDISGNWSNGGGDGGSGGDLLVRAGMNVTFKGNFNSEGRYASGSGDVTILDSTVDFQGNFKNGISDQLLGNPAPGLETVGGVPGDVLITDSVVTFRGTVDSAANRPEVPRGFDGGLYTIEGSNSEVTFEQEVDQSGGGTLNNHGGGSDSRTGAGDTASGGTLTVRDGAAVTFLGDLKATGGSGGTATGNGGDIAISGDGTSVTFAGAVNRLAGIRSDNTGGKSGDLTISGGTARFESGSSLQIAHESGVGTEGIVKIEGGTLEVPTLSWLTDPESFRGDISFTAGTLRTTASSAGAPVSLDASSALGTGFNAAAIGDRTLDTKDDLAFDATVALNGNGSFTKAGLGTLTLAGANTYTGATNVLGGKLVIDGSLASASVTVSSSGTLGGSGTVGAVTIASGGAISPGNSPGILNTGSETWDGGGTYVWELNSATGIAGTNWDLLNIGGTLSLDSLDVGDPFIIAITSLDSTNAPGAADNFDPAQSYSWILVTASGGISGFSADHFALDTGGFSNAPGSTRFSLTTVGNDLVLSYSAVPEPSTWGLIIMAGLLTLAVLRRHRSGSI